MIALKWNFMTISKTYVCANEEKTNDVANVKEELDEFYEESI